jgi:hypothetical protein
VGETAHSASIELTRPRRGIAAAAGARVVPAHLPLSIWLLVLVLASSAFRLMLALPIPAPWIIPDELVYSQLARSFGETGEFAIRGQPFSAWSFGPLYPILIAPAFSFVSPTTAYVLVKVINCLIFSLAALPAYFLARRVLTSRGALTVAGLAVFVPSAVYTSKVMTESLSYPLFIVAVLAMVRALEVQTPRREAAALATIVIAALARGQLVILLPAFVLTLVVLSILDERDETGASDLRQLARRLGAYRLTWLAAIATGVAMLGVSRTDLANEIAGGHGEAFAGVDVTALALSFVYHLAELDLYLGMLPVAAFAFVLPLAFRRRSNDRSLRIICMLTVALTVLLAAAAARYLVAVYATAPDPYLRVYDRYDFYVVPLFLIVFLVWLQRGLSRPTRAFSLCIAGTAAALPALLPFSKLISGGEWGTSSSSVALVPWAILRLTSGTTLAVYGALAVGAACLTYAAVRSTNRSRLLLLVAGNFVVLNLFAQAGNSRIAERALELGIGTHAERSWVDSAVGPEANVAALWSGVSQRTWKGWYPIWESEFFNASIRNVYELREPMRYPLPAVKLKTSGHNLYLADGKPFVADYVLTDVTTPVRGTWIASNQATGMVLYRVAGRVRLR